MNSAQEFERLCTGLRRLEASKFKHSGALATITRTSGATFRHAGTSMLVESDGNVVCALSGGCPQRDIVMRAVGVMRNDQPEIACYNHNSALDVLIEMGCGGEMEVLIEPLTRSQDLRFLDAVEKFQTLRVAGFMATAFARRGLALSPRPQRLVWAGGIEWNDIGDAALVDQILPVGLKATGNSRADLSTFETAQGQVDVLFEVLRPVHTLVVVGVNAVSLALVHIAAALGWKTFLIDPADSPLAMKDLPANINFLRANTDSIRKVVHLDNFSSAVVMTFNIERDLACLNALADAPVAYLGAIGSRERAARMRAAASAAGAQLHAPAGLDLGAQTPEEIALAVSAEILATLNARPGGKLSDFDDAISQ